MPKTAKVISAEATLSPHAGTGPDRFLVRPGPVFAERGGRGGVVLAGKVAPQSGQEEGEEIGGEGGHRHPARQRHDACRHQRSRREKSHLILLSLVLTGLPAAEPAVLKGS